MTLVAGAALTWTMPGAVPPPSETVAGKTTCNVAVSLSCTAIIALPLRKPGTVAVMTAVCVPSSSVSSTIVTSKDWLVCPAGMITLAGTVTSLVSLEARLTVRFVASGAYPPTMGPYFYVSIDSGATFRAGQRSGGAPLDMFAFDPTDVAGTHMLGLYTFDPNLYESHDGGSTWDSVAALPADAYERPVRLSRLAWSHQRPEVLYLAGSHASVYRSADVGRTWKKILSLTTLP